MKYCYRRTGIDIELPDVRLVPKGELLPVIRENGMYKIIYKPQLSIKFTKKAFEKYFAIAEGW